MLKAFCSGSKESKLQAVSPYFAAGNCQIPSSDYMRRQGLKDWTPEYVQELTQFPKSRFNDQVDATAMAVWRLLHTFEVHVNTNVISIGTPEASTTEVGAYGVAAESAAFSIRPAGGFDGMSFGWSGNTLHEKAYGRR